VVGCSRTFDLSSAQGADRLRRTLGEVRDSCRDVPWALVCEPSGGWWVEEGAALVTFLTTRQLNRALLARQMLLSRSTAAIPRALERMGGLQAQYAPAIYVGLWSRIAHLQRQRVTTALERRLIVEATLMRATIHVVSAGDYWPLTMAINEARRQWFLKVYRGPYGEADFVAAAETVRNLLASGPKTAAALTSAVGRDLWNAVWAFVDLVRVPPAGTWERRRADLYGLAENWIPTKKITTDASTEWLIKRYLGGFGPAVATDLGVWAGLPMDRIIPVLERMDLRRFQSEDGKVLVDLKMAALPDPDVSPPVRFLSVWDAILLVHARRKAVIAEEHRPIIFNTRNPQSMPTFMVDGVVAGTWRYQDAKVSVSPFDPIPRKHKRELEDEATALAAFHK